MGLRVTGRIIPQFLPVPEQPSAQAVVATAAASMLAQCEPGSSRALVAARQVAEVSAEENGDRTYKALTIKATRSEKTPVVPK